MNNFAFVVRKINVYTTHCRIFACPNGVKRDTELVFKRFLQAGNHAKNANRTRQSVGFSVNLVGSHCNIVAARSRIIAKRGHNDLAFLVRQSQFSNNNIGRKSRAATRIDAQNNGFYVVVLPQFPNHFGVASAFYLTIFVVFIVVANVAFGINNGNFILCRTHFFGVRLGVIIQRDAVDFFLIFQAHFPFYHRQHFVVIPLSIH